MHDGQYNHVERVLGTDPSDGEQIVARFGQYGPYVQKGEGEKRRFASLEKGQLIETVTLEEALKLLAFPKTVGSLDGTDIIVTKGKYGPYIKYGDLNVTLPRKTDPMTISLEECIAAVRAQQEAAPENNILKEFQEEDIAVINGRYGPYIKHGGKNFRIPKGTDAASLTIEQCREFIAGGPAGTARKSYRKFTKKK
jgi:DNA topoisomerase-1